MSAKKSVASVILDGSANEDQIIENENNDQ